MVFSCVIVRKTGEHAIQTTTSLDELYKSCNFRVTGDFAIQFEWNNICLNNIFFNVALWGKTKGIKSNLNQMHNLFDATHKSLYGNIAFVFQHPDSSFPNVDQDLWNAFLSSNALSTLTNVIPPTEPNTSSCYSLSKELTYDTYYFSD